MRHNDIKTLILDDNRQMLALLAAIMAAFGFRRIWRAVSIAEAKELCLDHKFDLIIADQRVEKTSGLDFVRWLRDPAVSPIHFVPVLMISAYSQRNKIIEAVNAGVDEFLVKPVKPVDIARRIDAVTYKRRKFVKTLNYFGPDRRRFVDPHFKGPHKRFDDHMAKEDVFEFD